MTDFERITNPVAYLYFVTAFDFIDLQNAETTLLSFSKVHFKSRHTSMYNYSHLKHSEIIGRIEKWLLRKGLLEAIDSQEMSV